MGRGESETGIAFDLRVSEELNRRIIEAMPGGIVHVAANGTVRTANAEALRILGLSYDELTKKYTRDFETVTVLEDGSPCSNEEYPVTRALVTGEPQPPLTIGVGKPDGQVSWAVFTAVPVFDPETRAVTGAIVTFLDITERKQLEAQMVVRDRLAAVGTLAAGVAHEINNPLTYVLANLEWLERDAKELSQQNRARIAAAVEGVERISRIVQDLGAFTQTREGAHVSCDVHEALESSLRMAAAELRPHTRVVRRYGTVPLVAADLARLGQVFVNLLINAAHAMADSEHREGVLELATTRIDPSRVQVCISDSGGGIPPEVAPRIFEAFFTTKPVGRGRGLGLYVCRHIVLSLGGDIRLDNEPGTGATFRIELPVVRSRVSSAPPRSGAPSLPRARVLVVDDEPAIRLILRDALEQHHDVEEAEDGEQALTLLTRNRFDVVLCDLLMPRLSGLALFARVTTEQPHLRGRFVFLTGGTISPEEEAKLSGVDCPILRKPFGARHVDEAVAQVVERLGRA